MTFFQVVFTLFHYNAFIFSFYFLVLHYIVFVFMFSIINNYHSHLSYCILIFSLYCIHIHMLHTVFIFIIIFKNSIFHIRLVFLEQLISTCYFQLHLLLDIHAILRILQDCMLFTHSMHHLGISGVPALLGLLACAHFAVRVRGYYFAFAG